MANFTKKEATLLVKENLVGAAGKYQLQDEQKNNIMQFIKDRSYATAYGSGLPVAEITKGSVTYTLDSGEYTSAPKGTTIGTGTIAAEDTGFIQKTVYLSAPKVIAKGFQEADLMMGMEEAVPVKYAKALYAMDREFEKGFIKNVANKSANILLDPAAITTADKAKEARDLLVESALSMSEIEDAKWALDGFEESRIFIDLSSVLFNRLVDERLITDEAMEIFEKGIFKVGNMGGFAVRRNEFLGKTGVVDSAGKVVHAIIATDVTAAGPRALVNAKAGELGDLSSDKGFHVEQKFANADGSATPTYSVMGVEPLLKVFGPTA